VATPRPQRALCAPVSHNGIVSRALRQRAASGSVDNGSVSGRHERPPGSTATRGRSLLVRYHASKEGGGASQRWRPTRCHVSTVYVQKPGDAVAAKKRTI